MRKTLVLLFVLFLSAGAFGSDYFPVVNSQLAIDGVISSNIVTICAGGQTGSLYRSTDYGTTWTSIANATVGNTILTGISIAGGTIFAGGTSGTGKVFKSVDWGSNWTGTAVLAGVAGVTDLFFQDANAGIATVIFGGGATWGVRYTTDGGANWNAPNLITQRFHL
ncbi:MAG: hypothetical protein LAP85_09575 [Acidobacteriia bacterium]|nr:hypothetical protein [Terriglobia bacterium]